jgi:GNAT superfamily N-acetyltransferase
MATFCNPRAYDKSNWLKLWQGYLEFYECELSEEINDLTWQRFFDESEPVFCLAAYEGEIMIGFVTYILRRSTWSKQYYCYLEDIFVDPSHRRKGWGRKLICAVKDSAQKLGCTRLYWMTHENNNTAQALYEKLADKSGFIQYRMPLEG